ncbi:hypothetical protein V8C35DRAFT_291905 [Trichoderma chlorosporum]
MRKYMHRLVLPRLHQCFFVLIVLPQDSNGWYCTCVYSTSYGVHLNGPHPLIVMLRTHSVAAIGMLPGPPSVWNPKDDCCLGEQRQRHAACAPYTGPSRGCEGEAG